MLKYVKNEMFLIILVASDMWKCGWTGTQWVNMYNEWMNEWKDLFSFVTQVSQT